MTSKLILNFKVSFRFPKRISRPTEFRRCADAQRLRARSGGPREDGRAMEKEKFATVRNGTKIEAWFNSQHQGRRVVLRPRLLCR
jgi:hypothetical protein